MPFFQKAELHGIALTKYIKKSYEMLRASAAKLKTDVCAALTYCLSPALALLWSSDIDFPTPAERNVREPPCISAECEHRENSPKSERHVRKVNDATDRARKKTQRSSRSLSSPLLSLRSFDISRLQVAIHRVVEGQEIFPAFLLPAECSALVRTPDRRAILGGELRAT